MSLPRLSFLYPPLYFSKRLFYPTVTAAAATRRHRHGTAVEPKPIPPSEEITNLVKDDVKKGQKEDLSPPSQSGPERGELKLSPLEAVIGAASAGAAAEKGTLEKPTPPSVPPPPPPPLQVSTPNLAPGEWVHHFDTYGLAKSLESSGFKNGQSVTIMKGIRGLLTKNLEVANENLVSKSDVENESYLFHAACSELRNEIQYTRKTHIDNLRADGAAIQQEYDLLNQKFLEDMMSLKDELNGLFNDRKMVTRAEQRAMENKIQELNYKITVLINSDLRSEIEKLRWTTTRRGLIAIAALAIFVVSSIRMSKSGNDDKKDKKSKEKNEEKDDTHNFENRLLPSDALAESLANSTPRTSGASFVSLG